MLSVFIPGLVFWMSFLYLSLNFFLGDYYAAALTKEHVEKLIELAFLKGPSMPLLNYLKASLFAIGDQHDTQPEDTAAIIAVTERKAANTFLSAFCWYLNEFTAACQEEAELHYINRRTNHPHRRTSWTSLVNRTGKRSLGKSRLKNNKGCWGCWSASLYHTTTRRCWEEMTAMSLNMTVDKNVDGLHADFARSRLDWPPEWLGLKAKELLEVVRTYVVVA